MERAARIFDRLGNAVVWSWFGTTFVAGIVFIFFMPPFQTNDETYHWSKLYSVRQGQSGCESVPVGAEEIVATSVYEQVRGGWRYELRRLDDSTKIAHGAQTPPRYAEACVYPRTAYLFPALVVRAVERIWPTRWGAVMAAFYAARLGNWLFLSVCVWLGMAMLPSLRAWLAAAYALPMMIHQSASINQDATIVGLHVVLLVVLLRTRPAVKLAGIVIIALLLTSMKIVFAPLLMLVSLPAWELLGRLGERRRRIVALAALGVAALVLVSSHWWIGPLLKRMAANMLAVRWANPAKQVALILDERFLLLTAFLHQLSDNLGHGHLTGGYVSILGVVGWAQYELSGDAFSAILESLVLALVAAILARPAPPPVAHRGPLAFFWLRVWPGVVPALVIFLVDFGFYLVFTTPGSPFIIGVQGRYYFGPLLLLGAAIAWLGARACEGALARLRRQPWTQAIRSGASMIAVAWAFYDMTLGWMDMARIISSAYYHHAASY
jgi:hypothetical protein